MWHQTFRLGSEIILTIITIVYQDSVFALFKSSTSTKPLMNNKFSWSLKSKLDACDRVSEWGDHTENKELNAVILMDFQFCCQVSNPFSPSVTQKLENPQLGGNSQCLFYLGGHHTARLFLSKSIYLLLTASIHQRWCWVWGTHEVTRSALGTRLPAINLTNILNHFICLYFPSWGLTTHQTYCL